MEKFTEEDAHRPAVEEEMVMGPANIVQIACPPDDKEAHEQVAAEIKGGRALQLHDLAANRLAPLLRERPEVLEIHPQRGIFDHHLQRAVGALMGEYRPQPVMPRQENIPALLQQPAVQAAAHGPADLLHVRWRALVGQGMMQHAFLHRREGVDSFDVLFRRSHLSFP